MTYATWLVYNNSEYPETATGYKAATYRCIYDKDGNLLSKEIEAYSEYHYHRGGHRLSDADPDSHPGADADPDRPL